MATDDAQVLVSGQATAPTNYTIPGNGQIRPKVIFAKYDGSAATGSYKPALKITSDGGATVGIFPTVDTVTAGGSVNVSWFPGIEPDDDTAATPGGGGTISSIVSPLGTIGVTAGTGPTTSLDLPVSGVAAGTYGDATHTAQVTVNAEGVVSAASQVAISGISGTGLVLLFDSTLGADAASIDTGAGAIPAGHGVLLIYVTVRSARAAQPTDTLFMRFNADAGTNYWRNLVLTINTGVSGRQSGFTPNAGVGLDCYGDTAPANAASAMDVVIPNYDGTTFSKTLLGRATLVSSTDVNSESIVGGYLWNNTAAISRVALLSSTGSNLRAGSRMQIYGAQ